jgi:iron complex outermembrane receptor protein
VWWDVQDPVMEDLERVEVIRGPGATLWGANAVNGVISIVSKSSKDTQGLLLSGGAGNVERGFGTVRYGGRLSENLTYRVFAKAGTRDDAPTTDGSKPYNGYKLAHGGARFDWEISKETLLTAQGDFYEGRMRETYVNSIPKMPPASLLTRGGNALSRLTHDFSEGSQLQLQAYYDETLRNGGGTYERRRTFDFDAQQRIRMVEWNEVVFGGGYRLMDDNLTGATYPKLVPPTSTTELFSAFLQDELTLVPDKLTLTVGTKVEHNDYTGLEVQPSARLLWRITPTQSVWAAVSRATRTPSRAERDLRIDTPTPAGTIARLTGNPNLLAGDMWAYELGHRINLGSKVLFDTAVFFNHYTRLRTSDPNGAPIPGAPPIVPVTTRNNLAADSYGIELGPRVNLAEWWRLRLAYSFLEIDAKPSPFAKGLDAAQIEGRSPQNMFSAVSSWDLPGNFDLDATVRYTSELSNLKVPAYVEMDLRLAWRMNQHVEFALVGQSLLNGQHAEFAPSVLNTQRTAVERSVYGSVTFKF